MVEIAIKTTILEFLADLKVVFSGKQEEGDILVVEFFFNRLDERTITNHVVTKILPHKKKIEKRKTQFFIKNRRDIFAGLPDDRVDSFTSLLTSDKVCSEDMKIVWRYFDTLIELAEIHKKRE